MRGTSLIGGGGIFLPLSFCLFCLPLLSLLSLLPLLPLLFLFPFPFLSTFYARPIT